jgi:hypothetical protein
MTKTWLSGYNRPPSIALEKNMSLGSWDPKAAQTETDFKIDPQILQRFIEISREQQLKEIDQLLNAEDKQTQAALMQQDKSNWFSAAESLSNDDLLDLMRFFTLAEKLPGWESGDKSPVIWLGKVLKKRGAGIDRDLVLWIKANSSNQFLPHGSLL